LEIYISVYIHEIHPLIVMSGAQQGKASCGGGEGGVPREKQDVEQNDVAKDTVAKDTVAKDTVAKDTVAKDTVAKDTVAKDTVADNGEDVPMSDKKFVKRMRELQKREIELAMKGSGLPVASAVGQHGGLPISMELNPTLMLMTNENYPPLSRFCSVVQNCENRDNYHVNSIILEFPQVHEKHAIIHINVSTAKWYIYSGPDNHPLTVNNVSVGQDHVQLHDGDTIVIGDVQLTFTCGVK